MIEKVHSVMLDKQRITIRQLSKELELSNVSGQSIITRFGHEMHLSEICSKTADS
jgi:hypothetical protein